MKIIKIALIGYGSVGKAFLQLLYDKQNYLINEEINIKVIYIIASNGGIYNASGIDYKKIIKFSKNNTDLTKYPYGGSVKINFNKIIENNDVDIIVEMTPTNKDTGEPGMMHITKALKNGINVITSNKGPILLAYRRLKKLAKEKNVQLGVGCTTGGALPTINGGMIDLAGSSILSIEGILNGTTNFILKEMEDNQVTYAEALKKAQKLNIAETNPTLDVDGWDTASKLLILTNILMNQDKTLNDIIVSGITEITPKQIKEARLKGEKYKLIGKTENINGKLCMNVKLQKIKSTHPLYYVDGRNKGVRYTSDTLGDLTILGGASGAIPAAASLLRDLININRGYDFLR